jgi:hypothetical protein
MDRSSVYSTAKVDCSSDVRSSAGAAVAGWAVDGLVAVVAEDGGIAGSGAGGGVMVVVHQGTIQAKLEVERLLSQAMPTPITHES